MNTKTLLIFSAMLALFSFAQSQPCSNFIKSNTDKFTDQTTVSQKKECVVSNSTGQKTSLAFSYFKNMLVLTWSNLNEGSACVDDNDILYFIFSNGAKTQVHYPGNLDCNTFFHFFFNADTFSDTYNLLTKYKITGVRFLTAKAVFEFDIPEKSSEYLSNVIKCLTTGK